MSTPPQRVDNRVARWIAVGGAVAAALVAIGSLAGLVLSLLFLDWRFWLLYLLTGTVAGLVTYSRVRALLLARTNRSSGQGRQAD